MSDRARTLGQQIQLLRERGMSVPDDRRAQSIMLEVGWYRLSLYWFPFELRYPDEMSTHHKFEKGTTFDDPLHLYAFEFNMRNMLLKYLARIETAFRTTLIYTVSTFYSDNPCWFADPQVVGARHARCFERTIYSMLRRSYQPIRVHHQRYPRDKFAPAWKTLEFVSFGSLVNIYDSLSATHLRDKIARQFGVTDSDKFSRYLAVMRDLRNSCAHGGVLYNFRPAEYKDLRFGDAYRITRKILGHLSQRSQRELDSQYAAMRHEFARSPRIIRVLEKIAGLN